MRRRIGTPAIAIAASLVTLLLLAGCSTKVVTAPDSEQLGTVTASGMGTAVAAPDQATMSFGVTRQSAQAKTALDDAAKIAEEITAAVKKAGVAAEDIQTQGITVYPLSTDTDGKVTISGYQATLSVSVTVKDLDKLGEVIAAATNAGADNVNGPSFTVDEDAEYREQAIAAAVEDARRSAEAMAKAADKTVGDVVRLSATDVFSAPLARAESLDAAAAAVPIEPGTLDIQASVTVVFELR